MCLRNFQTGTLSLKVLTNSATLSYNAEVASSTTTMSRDLSWYWQVPFANPTPTSMPAISAASPSTTEVAEYTYVIAIGYSSY
jgi:hypothetical protein